MQRQGESEEEDRREGGLIDLTTRVLFNKTKKHPSLRVKS